MIRDQDGQIKVAEPAIGEVEVYLFAESPFGPDAHNVADQQSMWIRSSVSTDGRPVEL